MLALGDLLAPGSGLLSQRGEVRVEVTVDSWLGKTVFQ